MRISLEFFCGINPVKIVTLLHGEYYMSIRLLVLGDYWVTPAVLGKLFRNPVASRQIDLPTIFSELRANQWRLISSLARRDTSLGYRAWYL